MSIAHDERCRINDSLVIRRIEILKPPNHRSRETFLYRLRLICIVTHCPKGKVILNQQYFRSASHETNNPSTAKLPTIQSDVIGPDASGQRRLIDEWPVQLINIKQQASAIGVPIEIDEAFYPIESIQVELIGRQSILRTS